MWKRKTEARGRPQLDSGDDTDHGGVVSATGKKKMKVVAELFREEEEQQMVGWLEETLSFTSVRASCPRSTTNCSKLLIPCVHIHCNNK